MYFTYVVRPGDAPEGRGPSRPFFLELFLDNKLRLGFALQLIGFLGVLFCSLSNGYSFNVISFLAPTSQPSACLGFSVIFLGIWLFGTVVLMASTNLADDDGSICQSRGYRAGCKGLSQATSLNFFGLAFMFVVAWTQVSYYEGTTLGAATTALKCIYYAAISINAVSSFYYAISTFLLEVYANEGTREFFGWLNSGLWNLTTLFQLLSILFPLSSVWETLYSIFLIFALGITTLWAFVFEPIAMKGQVKMTQSAVRNEYYKSRNALAYFGPPVMSETGNTGYPQQSGVHGY